MKFLSGLILIMFVSFLSMPTIVGMIEKGADTSIFFSMTEEELSHKEVKADLSWDTPEITFVFDDGRKSKIHSELLSRHDNVSATIFIPPPEKV